MKYLLFFSTFLLLSLASLAAQMNISTNVQRNFIYDEDKEDFTLISENKEDITFFVFNKDMTMFKHTTPSMTSAYIINSSKEDEEAKTWEFSITSDVGNKYVMMLDIKAQKLRFIVNKEGTTIVVEHGIKKVWFDE
jgi:hypothetical protein